MRTFPSNFLLKGETGAKDGMSDLDYENSHVNKTERPRKENAPRKKFMS